MLLSENLFRLEQAIKERTKIKRFLTKKHFILDGVFFVENKVFVELK